MTDDRVFIFDTTLRDGEQSPGISLNTGEKLEIAHQLARLGVDVIEAGFPITSPGDFEAVQAIARQVEGPVIAGLARAHVGDIDAAYGAVRDAERPRIHTFISTSDIHIEHQLASTREDVKGQARAAVAHARVARRRRRVLAHGRDARGRRVHRRGGADRARRGRDDDQHPRHRRLHDAARVRRLPGPPLRAGAGAARRRAVGALPRRPRARGGELVRRPAGGRAPGRVRDQRDRRAGGQRVARGDRDAAAHPRGRHRPAHGRQHARDRAHEPPGLAPHRLPGAAEQGDRGPQRVRPRVRHPPGRRAQGALDLRDHGRHHRRAGRQLARAGQALRPPRAQERAGGARATRSPARR